MFNHINKISEKIFNNDLNISGVSQLFDNVDNTITWCNDKNLNRLGDVKNKTIIVSENIPDNPNPKNNYIIVKSPRVEFKKLLDLLYPEVKNYEPILGNNVVIGDNVTIGCNNTIGGVGFGYEKNENGEYELIKHIGNVIISDNVEIGNNTCIDRGVIGSTLVGENCKIDNLVHIAHGVKIGKNSLIIANSMVAGSVIIGENVWVAPSTSIINGAKIGNNSMTGIATLVIKEINDNELHIGSPNKKLKDI